MKLCLVLFASLGLALATGAQPERETPAPAESSPAKPDASLPAFREIGNGIFALGAIRLDKNAKTVSFPASVNMTEGIAEYLLVRTGGKTHESVLVTKVEPRDLHVAMLLLGVKDRSKQTSSGAAPPSAINSAYLKDAPELAGENVLISVSWKSGDSAHQANAEDFLLNKKEGAPMSRGAWLYTGSELVNGKFLAQEERSIAALVLDPAAQINNPRAGNRDDSIWEINPKTTPPVDTPVEITIKLEQSTKP